MAEHRGDHGVRGRGRGRADPVAKVRPARVDPGDHLHRGDIPHYRLHVQHDGGSEEGVSSNHLHGGRGRLYFRPSRELFRAGPDGHLPLHHARGLHAADREVPGEHSLQCAPLLPRLGHHLAGGALPNHAAENAQCHHRTLHHEHGLHHPCGGAGHRWPDHPRQRCERGDLPHRGKPRLPHLHAGALGHLLHLWRPVHVLRAHG
mmetsp:Transcript_6822/g.16654  ORF Transcript_6822/g.16654 Transcript_6822/m.16654 type:complete len:204 (-) Transcript_6822:704-1315(-)